MTDTLELSHWIGGEKVAADRPGESHNPSDTRDIVARTPKGGAAEVDQAVAAATGGGGAHGVVADVAAFIRANPPAQ